MKKSPALKKAQAKYLKKLFTTSIAFNPDHFDEEIAIQKLKSESNKKAYILKLILKDVDSN